MKLIASTASIGATAALLFSMAPAAQAGQLLGDVRLDSPSTISVSGTSTAIDSQHTVSYTNRSGKNLVCHGFVGAEAPVSMIQMAENLAMDDRTMTGQQILLSAGLALEGLRSMPDYGHLNAPSAALFLPRGGQPQWTAEEKAPRSVPAGTTATWSFTTPTAGKVEAMVLCADRADDYTYAEVEFTTAHTPVDTTGLDAVTNAQLGSIMGGMASMQSLGSLG